MFAGGVRRERLRRRAAARRGEVLDLLAALVDKSLARAVADGGGAALPDAGDDPGVRGQRLDEAGERPAVEAAHTALVVELVETAEPRLRRADQLEWVARLRAETDDVAAVLRRAVAAGDAATAQRLVAASGWFWLIRGLFTEATDRLTEAAALDGPVPPAARALCTAYRAMAAAGDGDFTAASALLADAERSRRGCRPTGTPSCCSRAPSPRGSGTATRSRWSGWWPIRTPTRWARAFALFTRAQMAENEGDLDRQRADMRAGVPDVRCTGRPLGPGHDAVVAGRPGERRR